MNIVLAVAALSEALTGLILLASPRIALRLLLGTETIGMVEVVSRFGGIGLIGLGIACWPTDAGRQQLHGMVTYGALAALYLAYVGVSGPGGGLLLWPAVVVHAVLIVLLLAQRGKNDQGDTTARERDPVPSPDRRA